MPELVCAADDPRWLAERRAGVTATDITAIIGISPHESEYSLYWKKLGHIPDAHEDNDRLRLGRDLESIIVSRWLEQDTDFENMLFSTALYRNDARPWQLATPDRTVQQHHAGEMASVTHIHGVLEVKSWADADRSSWDDAPPPRVRAQVLWQMDTLDVETGNIGVLFLPSGEFRSLQLSRSSTSCQQDIELMRAAGEEFMARIRHELPPPSPDASSATLAALKARFTDPRKDKQAEIDLDLWNPWYGCCSEIDYWTEKKRSLETRIREQAGDAGILTVAGVPVARRTVSTVKAHWRKESTRDSITRIKNGETSE